MEVMLQDAGPKEDEIMMMQDAANAGPPEDGEYNAGCCHCWTIRGWRGCCRMLLLLDHQSMVRIMQNAGNIGPL